MHERQDPGARLGALGPERRRPSPDPEERLLHGVLGEPVVAEHPERETVGDPADAVVQLGQRAFVAAGDERDESLVREVSEVLAHGPGNRRVGQRYHGEWHEQASRLVRLAPLDRFGRPQPIEPPSARRREPAPIRVPTQGECNEESN